MTVRYGSGYASDRKKISIIVPCYKVEQYLPRCLDSLLGQTLEDIEVIAINDGSPDATIDILMAYQSRFPEKLVVIDKQNEGVWRGRQDAIRIAAGEYIGFVDSDDYVEPDFAECLYQTAKRESADIAVCGFYREDVDTGNNLSEEMTDQRASFNAQERPELLLQMNGAPWNKIFRAPLMKSMHDFENPPRIFDDMIMHLLVYPNTGKIAFAPKPLVHYIIRSDSIMTSIDRTKIDSAYSSMLEVRSYYEQVDVSSALMSFLDAAAFLHLGISLMFRLSYDPEADLASELARNKTYLNKYFPTWNSDEVISKRLSDEEGGAFTKIFKARKIYRAHLMRPALACYRFSIRTLHHDIKW